MRKKSTYLYFLVAIVILIAIAFAINISFIKSFTHSVLFAISNPWVCTSAIICAFILMGNKRYWILNISAAVLISIFIQLIIIGGGVGLYIIGVRAVAFLSVVYLLNLIKILLNK